DDPHGVGRSGALDDVVDRDPLLLEEPLILADEEHRVVAAGDVVELHGDVVELGGGVALPAAVGPARAAAEQEQGAGARERQAGDEFLVHRYSLVVVIGETGSRRVSSP